jgi:L-serine dehydratase
VGGGNILITGVNERETAFTGDSDTLIIAHDDKPGMIASVTSYLSARGVNIGNFRLHRPRKGLEAVMTLEVDGALEKRDVEELKRFPHITGIVYLRAYHSEG